MTDKIVNPYAPPITDDPPLDGGTHGIFGASNQPPQEQIAAALRRLNQHVANPVWLQRDARLAGSRFNVRIVALLLFVLVGVGLLLLALLQDSSINPWSVVPDYTMVMVLLLAVTTVVVINGLRLLPRHRATEPLAALRGAWLAAKMCRPAYFLSCLCPSARETTIRPPQLKRFPTGGGAFSMADIKQAREYLRSWAATGTWHVRWLSIVQMTVVGRGEDVAVVRTQLKLQVLPQWVNILSAVLFVLFRLIGLLVAVVLSYALRKTRPLTVDKVLLRGDNGIWYLFSATLDN